MNFQSIKKRIGFSFLMTYCLCNACGLYADALQFKAGDAASYTVTQKTDFATKLLFETIDHTYSDATIAFDVKILSSNSETLSYPFEVEVILKRMQVGEDVLKNGKRKNIVLFDSENQNDGKHCNETKYLMALINSPMHFTINGEFDVKETTGALKLDKNSDPDSELLIFGATPWSFEFLLTQIFHLSGENLELSNSYPVSSYQLVNWEDSKVDREEIDLLEKSAYTITSMDSEAIGASWQAATTLTGEVDATICVEGNITWDAVNPMVQQRNINIEMSQDTWWVYGKYSIQQVWQSTQF